ncbi:MAG TPA: hypothetical protein VJ949_09540 [Cryomorphaceae bacterium]|nr:hypothetical protein [Cryomorphaceae bacterium]
MNKKIFLIVGVLFFALSGKAQVYNYADGEGPVDPDSIKGLYIALNLGYYFANNNSAVIYGGYGYQRDGTINDFANAWLNRSIQGNPEFRRQTSTALGLADGEWAFTEDDMPGVMQFSGSFMYGGHLRYMFNADFGVYAEINGTNPVTVGEFTIQTFSPSPDPTQNQRLRRFGIRGEEQRLIVNLGLHRVLLREQFERQGRSTTILPYVDVGINFTFTKFEENFYSLDDGVVRDLTVFFNQQSQFVDEANLLTGAGFGGFAALGGQITLGSKFILNIGYNASFEQIKLGEVNERGLQSQVVLKAIYMF